MNRQDFTDSDDKCGDLRSYQTPFYLARIRDAVAAQNLPVRDQLALIEQQLDEIFAKYRIVHLEAGTGTGKSVFFWKALQRSLAKRGVSGQIVICQPRRDATKGIAEAISAVFNMWLGSEIGYSTSEAKEFTYDSQVLVVSTGVLVRYLASGRINSENVAALIVDEAHDTSLDMELIKGLIKTRKNLPAVAILTATPNPHDRVYFDLLDEQCLKVSGAQHELRISYVSETPDNPFVEAAELAMKHIQNTSKGDVLIFVPGKGEVYETLRNFKLPERVLGLPLYGEMSPSDRLAALLPGNPDNRKIIVATNVAESSITIGGLSLVIDTCLKRIPYFNAEDGCLEMVTEYISKDEAIQRGGRAARDQPGENIRLISKEEFERLEEHADPEITRSNLSQVVLRLIDSGIDPLTFEYYTEPRLELIEQAITELQLLDAVDEEGSITSIGRQLALVPFAPRIGRMIVESQRLGREEAVLVLAAFSRETRVYLGPTAEEMRKISAIVNQEWAKSELRNSIREARKSLEPSKSDWCLNLKVFQEAIKHGVFKLVESRRGSFIWRENYKVFTTWCRSLHLKPEALIHIAARLREYFALLRVDLNIETLPGKLDEITPEELGYCLLVGFPDQIAVSRDTQYRNPDTNITARVDRESMANKGRSRFVIYTEMMQRSSDSCFISGVHPIEPETLYQVRPDLFEINLVATYIPETGEVQASRQTSFEGQVIALQMIEPGELESEVVYGCLADALCSPQARPTSHFLNEKLVNQANCAWVLSRFGLPRFKLRDLYVDFLRKHGIRKLTPGYDIILNKEDYYTETELESLKMLLPETVQVAGRVRPVTYQYTTNRRISSVTGYAFIEVRVRLQLEDLNELTDADNPSDRLIPNTTGMACLLWEVVAGSKSYSYHSLEEAKKDLGMTIARQKLAELQAELEATPLPLNEETLDTMSVDEFVYFTDFNGKKYSIGYQYKLDTNVSPPVVRRTVCPNKRTMSLKKMLNILKLCRAILRKQSLTSP